MNKDKISMEFNKVCLLFQIEKDKSFVEEIRLEVENGEIFYHSGFILSSQEAYEMLWGRNQFQIQMRKNKTVLGYDEILPIINSIKDDQLLSFSITTRDYSYMIYTDTNITKLFGIVRSPYSNIEKLTMLIKQWKNLGLRTNIYLFNKGILDVTYNYVMLKNKKK